MKIILTNILAITLFSSIANANEEKKAKVQIPASPEEVTTYDKNKDGFIKGKEYREFIIGKFDSDGDKKLNKEEKAAYKKALTAFKSEPR